MENNDDPLYMAGEKISKVGRFFKRGSITGEQQCYSKVGFKAFQFICDQFNDAYKDCLGGVDEKGKGSKECFRQRLKIDSAYECIHHEAVVGSNKMEVCDWRHMPRLG